MKSNHTESSMAAGTELLRKAKEMQEKLNNTHKKDTDEKILNIKLEDK